MASPSQCQLWSLSADCQGLPQAAMLTPPQEAELDIPDMDNHGPGTRANPGQEKPLWPLESENPFISALKRQMLELVPHSRV